MPPPEHTSSTGARFDWPTALQLRPGERVEVRSREEILATLDAKGTLGGMPFMPEMLRYCGHQFTVYKRAEKSCDTVKTGHGRRVHDAVHLSNVRCDGTAHGGCQALCLMWWREAWLKRVSATRSPGAIPSAAVTEADLRAVTSSVDAATGDTVYSCQVTRMHDFSERQDWDRPGQYLREVLCGNVGPLKAIAVILHAALNAARRRFGLTPQPAIVGKCTGPTPAGTPLDLKPGDWVVVKSKEEIEATINAQKRNRGLAFDFEMLPYCGRRMQVLTKVERIINEETGRLTPLPNDCWILAGAFCQSFLSRNRLFCTRAIYSYWREIWLRRADPPPAEGNSAPAG